jgi:hypothetical protein
MRCSQGDRGTLKIKAHPHLRMYRAMLLSHFAKVKEEEHLVFPILYSNANTAKEQETHGF